MGRWNVFPNTHQSVVWWRLSWCWCCDIGVCFKTSIIIEATWRTDGCATSPMMVPKDVFNTKTTFPKTQFHFFVLLLFSPAGKINAFTNYSHMCRRLEGIIRRRQLPLGKRVGLIRVGLWVYVLNPIRNWAWPYLKRVGISELAPAGG